MTGSPFAALPGAVVDAGSVQHYGSPLAEQRALASGAAVCLLGDRRVLAVSGADRLSWLDSLSSQALAALAPGTSTELLILDPHGRVEHVAAVFDDGETTWLIVDAGDADPLLAWLGRMRFRLAVEPRDAPEFAVVGASALGETGPVPAAAVAAPHGVPLVWRDPWPGVSSGGHAYARPETHPGSERTWIEAIVPVAALGGLADAAASGQFRPAGLLAADALRIAAWRPRWAAEVDERTIPHEVDWLRTAVHLAKGCYRGQETVAKVHNLGHPPRRLVLLHLDGSDSVLPERGAPVLDGDAMVGAITSATLHHLDGPIALALVKRSVPVEQELVVRAGETDIVAAQQPIVPSDAGATASVPRLTRLSRRPAAT